MENVNISKTRHRGPDSSTIKIFNHASMRLTLGFHRLSIVGTSYEDNGDQPFYCDGVYVMCNGEIYNYKELIEKYSLTCTSKSDCEVILRLYLQSGTTKLSKLDGEYAYVIVDLNKNRVVYARDKCGVRPLYVYDCCEGLILSSEMKGIIPAGAVQVQPDMIFTYNMITFNTKVEPLPLIRPKENIRDLLIEAVRKRIDTDVSMGYLLSGGLDSSLVLSIASKLTPRTKNMNVFTCGFSEDAPDVVNAKKVISFLEGIYGKRYTHYIYIFPISTGIKAIPSVIKCIESYDTTTIRASTPMWLMMDRIRRLGIRIILSGEGSDEINGSYLYFHNAPSAEEFEVERARLVNEIHLYDGLRGDRCVSAFGMEYRVPFLDAAVVEATLASPDVYTTMKEHKIEKYLLRLLFEGYLPHEILWRQKEAFSDAVSKSWVTTIKEHAQELNVELPENIHLPPKTPEEKWYRKIFEEEYPGCSNILQHMWLPKWSGNLIDPSARYVQI